MNFSKLYRKLPKKIQDSEKLMIYCIRFVKFIRSKKLRKNEPAKNNLLNFIFKSSTIKPTGTIRDIQLLYLELLKFIDNVCEKHDLDYCLTYGTLLGAIRHEGFIPWDDDCDILMMRKDYDKFIEVLPEEINKYEFFKENCALTRLINSTDNYFTDFNNIYHKEIGHDDFFNLPGLGKSLFLQLGWLKPMVKLDIFPYDYVKEESVNYYTKNYLGHKFYFRGLYSQENFSFEKEFTKRFEELGLSYEPTNFIAEGIDASFIEDFPPFKKELIFPTKRLKFDEYELKCPNKSHELLKLWYGDNYTDIPQNVVVHGYADYNLTLFESKSEMDNAFKDTIEKLKEINHNFE